MGNNTQNTDLSRNEGNTMLGEVKITDMVDWSKITDNEKIKALIKERELIECEIRRLDKMALVNFELEALRF